MTVLDGVVSVALPAPDHRARCRMTTLVGLDVSGRRVVVAGGGPVAARRATALARDGAVVTVVAPQLCEDLVDAVADGTVSWVDREVAEADLAQAWLVHAATDDPGVNAQVAQWATARRVWSVCASDAELGTARTPATTEHAGLLVGVVSTGSRRPPARRAGCATSCERPCSPARSTCAPDAGRGRRRAGWCSSAAAPAPPT